MWRIIGTTVQGRGHIKHNVPGQDKIYGKKGNVDVISLADGAGSASQSHDGAELVTKSICHLMDREFDTIFQSDSIIDVQKFIMKKLLKDLNKWADQLEVPVKQLASTLLAVAVKGEEVLIVHLGDGEIGAVKNDEVISVSTSSNGEYANSTFFTTSNHAWKQLKLFRSRESSNFSSFFLMSDGTAMSMYSKKRNAFSPILKQLEEKMKVHKEKVLNAYLKESFEKLIKQQTQDDCSLIMMANVDQQSGYSEMGRQDKEMLIDYLDDSKSCSINKWDRIIKFMHVPRTLKQVSKLIGVKKHVTKKNMNALIKLEILSQQNGKYYVRDEN